MVYCRYIWNSYISKFMKWFYKQPEMMKSGYISKSMNFLKVSLLSSLFLYFSSINSLFIILHGIGVVCKIILVCHSHHHTYRKMFLVLFCFYWYSSGWGKVKASCYLVAFIVASQHIMHFTWHFWNVFTCMKTLFPQLLKQTKNIVEW